VPYSPGYARLRFGDYGSCHAETRSARRVGDDLAIRSPAGPAAINLRIVTRFPAVEVHELDGGDAVLRALRVSA
jgi:hypothetical protein